MSAKRTSVAPSPKRYDLDALLAGLAALRVVAAGVAVAREGGDSAVLGLLRHEGDAPPAPGPRAMWGGLWHDLRAAAAVNAPGPHGKQVVRIAKWCVGAGAACRGMPDAELLDLAAERWADALAKDTLDARQAALSDLLRAEYSAIESPTPHRNRPSAGNLDAQACAAVDALEAKGMRGWTRKDVAEILGVTVSALAKKQRDGRVRCPDFLSRERSRKANGREVRSMRRSAGWKS